MNLRLTARFTVTTLALWATTGCYSTPVADETDDESGDTVAVDTEPDPTATGPVGGDTTTPPGTTTGQPPMTTAGTAEDDGTTVGNDDTDDTTGEPPPPMCEVTSGGECNTYAQDCPEGEKCTPWASDGGATWNSTRCAPIDPRPSEVGEACFAEGLGLAGADDCVRGAMCWDVDPRSGIGTCIELCTCGEPMCGEMATCIVSNGGALAICEPTCDPLLQDCAPGQGCYPSTQVFACAPDASGEMGAVGDPCEFVNTCNPGTACITAASLPSCAGSGCCSPFCDFTDPSPECPDGTVCNSWFGEGAAPRGLEDVGVCTIP